MGSATVNANPLNTLAIFIAAYLAVFMESYLGWMRNWIGAQVDVLPALMVYCGLSTGLFTLTALAILGGLWFDSLSANPLGITVLPLFLAGFAVYRARELVLRDQAYARLVLGIAASAAVPLCTVLLLWGGGYDPLISWASVWQWIVMALGGGLFTPVCFWLFGRLHQALDYSRPSEPVYRSDREMKRGRV